MLKRENYNGLYDFLIIAKEKSFSKAAQQIGISPPALSKKIQLLEKKLGVQLFNRTTRQVALTQVGEQLFRATEISFARLDNELTLIEHYRNSPSGIVRINCGLQIIQNILLPKLAHFKQRYPDIQLELISENQFVDIIASRFDAGVRLGNDVAEDMIAVRISDPMKMATVASVDYFQQHGIPETIEELAQHSCICYRLTNGGFYQWEFNDNGNIIKFSPQGQWILNDDYSTIAAAKLGLGIAYLPEDLIINELESNEFMRLFTKYSYSLPALYLYYPHRNVSSALRAVIGCLKI